MKDLGPIEGPPTPRRIVTFRGWPGLEHWTPPKKPSRHHDRLADRNGLVMIVLANRSASIAEFGVGAYLEINGRAILGGGVIVPDHISDWVARGLDEWVLCYSLETTSGVRSLHVVTRSAFCEPHHGPFARVVYAGAGWCIGADLGTTLGLLVEHTSWRNGRHDGECELWLPGWGKEHDRGRWKRCSPHRPQIWMEERRAGTSVRFAPLEMGFGRYDRGRQWRDAFIDTKGLAHALDGDRAASLSEHLENAGLAPVEFLVAVNLDARGAKHAFHQVLAIHSLAVALDEQASRWF